MIVPISGLETSLAGKQVLVTGAGGFIGSHLVERLLAAGARVRAMVRYSSTGQSGFLQTIGHPNLEVFYGDVCDPQRMDAAVERCQYVYHLAALVAIPYSYQAAKSYVDSNAQGTLNVLQAAKRFGVERLIQVSTSEVYGTAQFVPMDESHPLRPQSPYAATKVASDQLALSFYYSFGVPVTVIRPFNTYGPRQSLRAVIPTIFSQAARGNEIRLGNLDSERDFTFVQDTCRGFSLASVTPELEGKTINLGFGSSISISDLVELIGKVLGKPLQAVVSDERLRPKGSEVERLCSNNELAKRLMGWSPQVSLAQGLEQVWRWMEKIPPESFETRYVV